MGVSVIDRHVFGTPHLSGKQFLEEAERARKRPLSRRLRLLLRLGIQILIVLLLLGVVWVDPVISWLKQ